MQFVGKVNPRDALVLPPLAERCLIVKQRQLLYDIVHDQVHIYRWLITYALSVVLTQLEDHVDVESIIWVQS